jgi:hypothetical protein
MSKVSISHERLPEPASVVLDYLNDFEQTIQDTVCTLANVEAHFQNEREQVADHGSVEKLSDAVSRMKLCFGFMETPDVRKALVDANFDVMGASFFRRGLRSPLTRPSAYSHAALMGANRLVVIVLILLGIIVPVGILLGGCTRPFEHPRIAHLRLLLATPNHLNDEAPIIAIVEQEQHRVPDLRERLSYTGALHTSGVVALAHVGEQLVLRLGAHHVGVGQLGVEAECVVELEVERAHDGLGEINELLVTRNLDLSVDLGMILEGDPENVG